MSKIWVTQRTVKLQIGGLTSLVGVAKTKQGAMRLAKEERDRLTPHEGMFRRAGCRGVEITIMPREVRG